MLEKPVLYMVCTHKVLVDETFGTVVETKGLKQRVQTFSLVSLTSGISVSPMGITRFLK